MPHIPYDYYDVLAGGKAHAFDAEKAYQFLASHPDPVCEARLAHWRGDIDDEAFWNIMGSYQGTNGGFKGGIDPDYKGEVGSIHSTIEAMRIFIAHQLFEGPHITRMLDFLRTTALPDGSWQEIPEVLAQPTCPAWYQPAKFRICETACLAGYALEFGAYDLWTNAVRFIRQNWLQMPDAHTAHPYWAAILLLGRSTTSSDRSIALDALDNLNAFVRNRKIDAYDCSAIVEILIGLDTSEVDDTLLKLLDMLGAAQNLDDGGIRTEYGDALRPSATFNALMAVALLMQRGLVENH